MEVRESQKQRSEAIKVAKCQTLCWDCANSTDINACPWASEGKPVDGWWALPRKQKYRIEATQFLPARTRIEDTYCVIMCPLFKRDAYRAGLSPLKEEHTDINDASDLDLRRIAAAVITQAVLDWERLERGKFKKTITAEGSTVKAINLIEWFNSPEFAVMLSAVSHFTPKQIREKLEVPDARH